MLDFHDGLLRLSPKRVDRFEEGNAMEIRVTRADPADAVLAHQHRRLRVLEHMTRELGHLLDHLSQHPGVAVGRHQHAQTRGLLHGGQETKSLLGSPRVTEDPWVRDYPEELVTDPPGPVPGAAAPAPAVQ